MTGLIAFAPWYVNGVLALFCVFALPGLVLAKAVLMDNFPLRWLIIFLASLATNHFLVTSIALFQLDPVNSYRAAIILATAALAFSFRRSLRSIKIELIDVGWFSLSIVVLGFAYFNIWKHGVPHVFEGGDVSASWNAWARIWAEGRFPISSYGYPQFVPTIWAVTYVFTGSAEEYFAFYIYLLLIIAPLVLNAMNLGRISWWYPLLQGTVFVWFVAEIQENWLRRTLEQAYPDWIATVFVFCGVVLFLSDKPDGRMTRDNAARGLGSVCLVSIAAVTKPLFGLVAVAVLAGVCADAASGLERKHRNRFFAAAISIVLLFGMTYAVEYSQLVARSLPNYPAAKLSDRLDAGLALLNANFTIGFRLLALSGLLCSFFFKRVRWLSIPLAAGFSIWASTASYDLRNVLGIVLIAAFIPPYLVTEHFLTTRATFEGFSSRTSDFAVGVGFVLLLILLTLPLARPYADISGRFADEQMEAGAGAEINKIVQRAVERGCMVFSGDQFIFYIAALQPFLRQMRYFSFSEPMSASLKESLTAVRGCTYILHPSWRSHPSLRQFIEDYARPHGFKTVASVEDGDELLEFEGPHGEADLNNGPGR